MKNNILNLKVIINEENEIDVVTVNDKYYDVSELYEINVDNVECIEYSSILDIHKNDYNTVEELFNLLENKSDTLNYFIRQYGTGILDDIEKFVKEFNLEELGSEFYIHRNIEEYAREVFLSGLEPNSLSEKQMYNILHYMDWKAYGDELATDFIKLEDDTYFEIVY